MFGYGYDKPEYKYLMLQNWDIMDSFNGEQPRCGKCGRKTEVFTTGDYSVVVCTICNLSARVVTKNMNHAIASYHRFTVPIAPARGY